jgi:hypothetical protein
MSVETYYFGVDRAVRGLIAATSDNPSARNNQLPSIFKSN